jgi:hypothetical protein
MAGVGALTRLIAFKRRLSLELHPNLVAVLACGIARDLSFCFFRDIAPVGVQAVPNDCAVICEARQLF